MKVKVFIGVMGSGKDFHASKCDAVVAFADQLREDIWTMIGWRPKTDAEYQAFKSTQFISSTSWTSMGNQPKFTGRDLMQRYGTEVRRNENPEHWAKSLQKTLRDLNMKNLDNPSFTVGVADCRFENEIKAIKELEDYGIRVEFVHVNFESDRYKVDPSHVSEAMSIKCLEFWGDTAKFNQFIDEV